jgi:prolyl-tRNA synthetase
MRGREFLMKDAYSFDLDEAGARQSYYTQMLAYLRTFQRIGIQAVPMKAESGPIGGDLSHEFIVLAPTGESEVFYDEAYEEFDWHQSELSYGDEAGLQALFERVSSTYAATDETHDEARWNKVAEDRRRTGRGIEVGHIFYFGDKYSAAMGLKVSGQDGTPVTPMMGSYGVGVSRLVGAVIEASHDDAGIIWPESVAPWLIGLVNMRHDDPACVAVAEDLYAKLQRVGDVTLYDDREERGGVKLGSMDVIGLPLQFIVGPKSVGQGMIETKNRRSGQRELLPVDRAVEVVASMLPAGAAPMDPRL